MTANEREDQPSFATLLQRVREGDDEAAWDLVQRYGPYVLRTIRRSLGREIRGKFDSEDFAQAVWASFFAATERFSDVRGAQHFVGLLATMARNKVVDEMRRRMQSQKYAVDRECQMQTLSNGDAEVASREPTPSQFAVARERWLRLLEAQPERERQIMRLKLMGRSNHTIAVQLNVSERTVRRAIERLMEDQS